MAIQLLKKAGNYKKNFSTHFSVDMLIDVLF